MGALLAETISKLKIGKPLFARNLTIYPLSNGGKASSSIVTFAEALDNGTVSANELEVPSVNEIILDNRGSDHLFLMDGEEIFGARQTRVTTTASLLEARSRTQVPVACIEEGRWEGQGSFEGSATSTHPRLRSIICQGVNRSLESSRSFRAPQRLVWDEVSRKLTSLKVSSTTSSFHDLATTLAGDTERYVLDSHELNDAEGMIVAAGGEVLGMEYARSTDLFKRIAPRLLRGYGLDALERRTVTDPPSKRELERFLARISQLEPSRYPGVALGEDWRFEDRKLVGRSLVLEDAVLQASFFPILN